MNTFASHRVFENFDAVGKASSQLDHSTRECSGVAPVRNLISEFLVTAINSSWYTGWMNPEKSNRIYAIRIHVGVLSSYRFGPARGQFPFALIQYMTMCNLFAAYCFFDDRIHERKAERCVWPTSHCWMLSLASGNAMYCGLFPSSFFSLRLN